jgi:signal transduction histidine kinase
MRIITRIIAFFQTLRGKLILTYTTVTVLALLALELMILLTAFAFSGGMNSDKLAYLSDVVSVLPPQARIYLQPGAFDQTGLQAWLQATYEGGYASLPPQGLLDSPAAAIVKSEPMYVIAPDGTVLAAAPASALSLVGRKYSPPANVVRSQAILDNALQLELESSRVSAIRPDGNYLMAVAVRQGQGKGPLAAVIIVTVKAPPAVMGNLWPVILGIVIATGFVLLMAVAPFGALFGFIMSRGLTRRLKALTLAADAWSDGDFSVLPQDRAKDEISYLGMRLRRMAEHVQALLQTQQELALLEQRNRLARELHDTVKQETFATLMQVRAAKNLLDQDPAAARQRLEEAEQLIKTSQQELGMIISELRPSALDGQGLARALSGYLDTWSQQACIPADIQVQVDNGGQRPPEHPADSVLPVDKGGYRTPVHPREPRLPLEVELALFRVAQEALSNVARHSRASAATVRLGFEPNQVTLCIADNGVGLEMKAGGLEMKAGGLTMKAGGLTMKAGGLTMKAGGSGFGLQSMRDRMTAIQGSLIIQRAPEGGTTVIARAPIPYQAQE